jgi:acyl-CoA reductase-like NAD-dependent aldehyde dehydrogenase
MSALSTATVSSRCERRSGQSSLRCQCRAPPRAGSSLFSLGRSLEGSSTEIDKDTVAHHFHEPLGVVGQIIPFNFPLLMAAWKIAPVLAAGNCTVIKSAAPTPWSILKLAEVINDVVPPGVINIVTGPRAEIGKALATNKRIAKIGLTGGGTLVDQLDPSPEAPLPTGVESVAHE